MHDLASIMNLSVGDHLCCMYMTEEEHRAILTMFIRDGFMHKDKIIYIVDVRTAETVFGYLDEEGVDTSGYIDSGQLVVAESRDTYIREGHFDPDSMLALLRRETDKAQEQGFRALRVTGEMSWALRGAPGSERLMEYEGKLNQFFPVNKAIGLCQYDMRSFDPEVLLDVLATHPIAIVRNKCYDNMYFVPPEEFLSDGDKAGAELKRRIKNLDDRQRIELERARFEKELKRSEDQAKREAEFSNAVLDTAGALIVVLDRQGHIVRFNRTCELLTGYKAEEVLGKSIWEFFVPPEEVQATRSVFSELSAGRFPSRLENDWIAKDGSRIRVAWSNTCLLDSKDDVDMVVSIGLDVTEIALMERAREREFTSLREYSGGQGTSRTASSLGIDSLQKKDPHAFKELATALGDFMDMAVETSIYKVKHNFSGELRRMAERQGRMRSGPRDLVQAHIQALQKKTGVMNDKMARAYTEEGRLLLIELMGYLATYYFNQCLGKGELGREGGKNQP
ncbi:MAG: MEDS domain-containing protein [Desulfovibrionales bacterium]